MTAHSGVGCINRTVTRGLLGLLLAAALPTDASAWWNTAWKLRRKVYLNGGSITQNLADFPVLVRLDASRIEYFRTQDAGQDLRFVDADDTTVLAHEIELWNESGTSYVWVRVPQVDAASTTDFIYVYYDNTGAADGQSATAVWDASHRGVWHLKEDPAGAPPQMKDSTVNANHGVTEASPAQTAGQVGFGLGFDGTLDRNVNVPHNASLQLPTSMTVSAWARTTSADAQSRLIVAKWRTTGSANYWLGDLTGTTVNFGVDGGPTAGAPLALVNDGAWHHVVGVADAGAGLLRIYVDGIQRNTAPYAGTSQTGTSELRIGRSPDISLQDWNGDIDEVRVESTARPLDWVRAQHLSMTDALLSFGTVECAFGCQGLSVSESGGVTVGSANFFEVFFSASSGGHAQDLYDLQESPTKDAVHDLAGGATTQTGLFIDEISWAGPTPPAGNYRSDKNPQVGRGIAAPIEVTPTRVMVRSQSVFASGSNVLPGVRGIGDWTVYPVGRVALHWSRITNQALPIVWEQLHLNSHYQASGALSTWQAYTPSGTICSTCSVTVPPTLQDFLLLQNEQPEARTDFLQIQHVDWPRTTTIDTSANAAQEWFENTWHDVGSPHTIPTDTTESWDLLTYFKPTVLQSHSDPAVTARSADYRNPDDLASPAAPAAGTGWFDAAEGTSGPSDFFNEKEAAYALNLDPLAGLNFDIDGGTTVRHQPFFKIRQWRALGAPVTIQLEGATLTRGTHYNADVMPISRGGIYRDYLFHSTLQDLASITSPDIGSAGSVTGAPGYEAARFGQGTRLSASGDSIRVPLAGNFNAARGSLSFWFRPTWPSTDGVLHDICGFVSDASNRFVLEKRADNNLYWTIVAGGTTSELSVLAANFDWRVGDWVHVQLDWDDALGLTTQMRLYFGDREPTHNDPVADYNGASLSLAAGSFRFGNTDGDGTFAAGLYDEIDIISDVKLLSRAGLLSDSREYFADASAGRNEQLDFMPVDAQRRGRYLSMGATAKFRGLNVGLTVPGTGVAANALQWEYWNGSQWASLNGVAGYTDETNSLTKTGSIYWGDPPGWAPYSVFGGVEIYRIRAHLPSGSSYTGYPTEGLIKTDVLLLQYCGDITSDAQTFVIAAPLPTAVTLQSFTATPRDGAVQLGWRTASELDNLGFNLYRGDGPHGPWRKLTASLVPGLGSSPTGASYSWLDSGLANGRTYFYRLEDVDTKALSTFHGPVSATPVAAAGAPGTDDGSRGARDGGTGDSACPEWVLTAYAETAGGSPTSFVSCSRHGEPEATSLELLSHTRSGALLELRTGGFYAVREAGGSVRLFVPGFDAPSDPDGLDLPLRRALVDAVVGKQVRLVSSAGFDPRAFRGLQPSAAGEAEMRLARDGTIRPARRVRRAPQTRRRGARERALAPLARLLEPIFQGEDKRAVVEIQPLRYDEARRQLVLARRVRVRLAFAGNEPAEVGTGSRGRRLRPPASVPETVVQLHTSRPGLHVVTFEELFPDRRRGMPVSSLRLQRRGQAAAFHVEPDTTEFGPGSRLYFLADRAAASTDHSAEVAWELLASGEGRQMPRVPARPGAPAATSDAATSARFETNRIYQPGLLDAPDLWLWEAVVAGAPPRAVGFTLAGVDLATSRPGELELLLQGGSESGAELDHHVRVALNGVVAGETRFAGKQPHTLRLAVPAALLREGENTLELTNVGDTGVSSLVFLDRLRVSYPRLPLLLAGRLEAVFQATGAVEVAGVAGAAIVLDLGPPEDGGRWLTGVEALPGAVRFHAEAGRSYLVVAAAGLLRPRVRHPAAPRLVGTELQADYVVLGPSALLDAARPLVERRESQGLSVITASFEEVADAFGHGQPSAEAIREFLGHAFLSWHRPAPRYVLLLGDASYDPQRFLASSVPAQLPALWTRTSYLWTVSDPALAAVNGSDSFPDLAIGRLPAATKAQAEALVAKLLAWEDSQQDLAGRAVLVADDPDLAGPFEADVEDIRASFLAGRDTHTIRLRELGALTRGAILQAFDDGASLMSYVGHGGAAVWASENVLNSWDVPSLRAQSRQPLLLTLNCLNGYFVAPSFDSLSEALLKAEGRGAIAAFSPSGLSLDGPAHQYHRALMAELTSDRHERLGDALLAAQQAYAATGLMPELLLVYQLLGDPAMPLR